MHILNVVGARPNLMKIAPLVEQMERAPDVRQTLLHTGQHYDEKMSQIFFDEMRISAPNIDIEVGSENHGSQTAQMLMGIENLLIEKPD